MMYLYVYLYIYIYINRFHIVKNYYCLWEIKIFIIQRELIELHMYIDCLGDHGIS